MAYFELTVTNFLAVLVLLVIVVYKWIQNRKLNYPPGPISLPFVGYLPFLMKEGYKKVWNLSKKYGDLFCFYFGPQLVISVNEYEMAKEILSHPMTLARPPNSFDFLVGKGGFVSMNGDEWHDQRRFTMHTMRDLGLGKGLWETMIQVDAAEYVKKMKKENGKPVIFVEPLALSQIANSLSLLFGRHLDQDQESDMQDILQIRSFTKKMMEKASGVDIGFTLPCLVKIVEFFNLFGFKEFVTLMKNLQEIFQKEVDKRMNSKEEHTSSDFIGCYLQEMEKREQDSKPHTFTRINLQGNLFIMFLSGQDSTLASVSWLLLLMAKYPEVQQKVCDEIDRVIGRDGAVYFSEKGNLPYTTATVFEMMRYISISPFFPNRYVLDSFEFHGYTIPKGSHLVCNNWAISHDPRYFKDPMTFNPERFLVENGTKFEKVKGYGPFSFGKRNCPGEGIAMMTMYLYFVSIMQKFYVRPKDDQPPDMKPVYVGGGLMPKVQPLRFIER